ncbi:MAG TPA: hypothetical protein DDW78_01025 [Treponema sp.]|nr:hypothetical protein [Treponema sp.]
MDVEKIIVRMKNQPNAICPADAEKVLEAYGYTFDRQKGSHRIYVNKEYKETLSIPYKNPIKAFYVKEILKRINR